MTLQEVYPDEKPAESILVLEAAERDLDDPLRPENPPFVPRRIKGKYSWIESWFLGNRKPRRITAEYRRFGRNLLMDDVGIYSYGSHFPLVLECENGYLLNGDTYEVCTDQAGWHNSVTTTAHQSAVRMVCDEFCRKYEKNRAILPFSTLHAAGIYRIRPEDYKIPLFILDTTEDQYKEVEYTDPKTGERKTRDEHLLGASLIRAGDRLFLSSTDASSHFGFGYFLTEIETQFSLNAEWRHIELVELAYEYLKPSVIRYAENQGLTVQRQGEWFFVPGIHIQDAHFEIFNRRKCKLPAMKGMTLPTDDGSTGHHYPLEMISVDDDHIMVRGTVRHYDSPRSEWNKPRSEHKMVRLGKVWHQAIHNRQIRSWSAKGRVD